MRPNAPVIANSSLPNRCFIKIDFHFMPSCLTEKDKQLNQALLVIEHAQVQAGDVRYQIMSIDNVVHFSKYLRSLVEKHYLGLGAPNGFLYTPSQDSLS
jgi:hypothetical protein